MFQSLFSQTLLQRSTCRCQLQYNSVSILVFLDSPATQVVAISMSETARFNPYFPGLSCNKPFLRKKSFTKRTLFLLRKEYLSGEGIGNPNLFFFGSNLFLKGLMFQSLFSWTLLQPSKFYSIPIFWYVLTLFISFDMPGCS